MMELHLLDQMNLYMLLRKYCVKEQYLQVLNSNNKIELEITSYNK